MSRKTKKRSIVLRSPTEPEYRSMAALFANYNNSPISFMILRSIFLYLSLCGMILKLLFISQLTLFFLKEQNILIDCRLVRDKFTYGFIQPKHISWSFDPATYILDCSSSPPSKSYMILILWPLSCREKDSYCFRMRCLCSTSIYSLQTWICWYDLYFNLFRYEWCGGLNLERSPSPRSQIYTFIACLWIRYR